MTDADTVRAAFDALKAQDLRSMPSFNAVLERPAADHVNSRASLVFRLVAAGIVIAAIAATYAKVSATHQRFTVPSEVVALGAWRPATDVLLPSTPGAFGAGPALGRSMLDLDPLTTGVTR